MAIVSCPAMGLFCWFERLSPKTPFSANCLILQDKTHCCSLEQIQCNRTPGCKFRLSGEVQTNNNFLKKDFKCRSCSFRRRWKTQGEFLFFQNGAGILKTKEKGKPTVKSPINFNMRWLEDAISVITMLKLQLGWLFRGPALAKLQPGETFPRSKPCSSLQPWQSVQQS